MITETLSDEEAAMLWSGDTSSLLNLKEETPQEVVETTEKKEESTETTTENKIVINEDELDNLFSEETEELEETTTKESQIEDTKKVGRKTSDLVSIVNQLVTDGDLNPFEDGEIKTIEDAKELIKLNIKQRDTNNEDEWWTDKLKKYSPQVQTILHYAEQGAKDITPLLQAISQIESTQTYELDTIEGQESIIRETLLEKQFDADEIEDQIATLKETGKLEEKATKFKPQLDNIRVARVQKMIEQQEQRQQQARIASDKYLETITNTLKKDTVGSIKLKREDKAKIFESLAKSNYTSLNGTPTNGFVKALENMQFGENADYEHFLNIVYLAVDKDSFYDKLRNEIKNDVTVENVRKLKESKTNTPNTEQSFETQIQKKNTIARNSFKNPFS